MVVVHPRLVAPSALAPLLRRGDRPGFVVVDMTELDAFAHVPDVDLPDATSRSAGAGQATTAPGSASPPPTPATEAAQRHQVEAAVAVSARARSRVTAAAGSSAPKTADPATKTSAPASAHTSTVSRRHAAVDLQPHVEVAALEDLAGAADLRHDDVEERLAAEARLDGHDAAACRARAAGRRTARPAVAGLERHPRPRPGRAQGPRQPHRGACAASTWKVTEPAPASA